MKKYIAWVLVFALCLVGFVNGVAAYAEDENNMFTPTLADLAEQTSKDFLATSRNRALLTVLLSIDLSMVVDDLDAGCFTYDSYVGTWESDVGDILCVFLMNGNQTGYYIFYTPGVGLAQYNRLELDNESLEIMVKAVCDNYYQNDPEDVEWALYSLIEIFSEE